MLNLILIRGVSGAGKSTLAETYRPITPAIFSADDFFVDEDGTYMFRHDELKQAHHVCLQKTVTAMKFDVSPVVVHNTFTRDWEMQAYMDAAKENGYQVITLVVENRHGSKSIHGVPSDVVNLHRSNLKDNLVL